MKGIGKLNDRHKRLLVVTGCIVLCAVLVVTIGMKFQSAAQTSGTVPSSSKAGAVAPSTESGTAGTTSGGKSVTVQANTSSSEASVTEPAQTDQPVQNLQPPVSKPAAPPASEAKNPSSPPKSSSSASSTPQAGDTHDGQVYLPGFGWVTDTGGSGSTVGSSGDQLTGNKVGQLD